MNKLEKYFTSIDVCPSSLASFIVYENLESDYKRHYLAEDVDLRSLELVDSYIDRKDSYLNYYILKFEGKFYKLTLHFESYGATWDTENVSWKNYTEVVPVTKTVVDYEVE